MRSLRHNFTAAAFLLSAGVAQAGAITDLDGDGHEVTFSDHSDISCPAQFGPAQVEAIIEISTQGNPVGPGGPGGPGGPDGPTGPPAPLTLRLIDQSAPGGDTLLMQVTIPPETVQLMMLATSLSPSSTLVEGTMHLSFPLHCDEGCGVEGRDDAVGNPGVFHPAGQGGGPPGPDVGLGAIGVEIPIEAVGQSGRTCVDLAVEQAEGAVNFSSGDAVLCCGSGDVPALAVPGAVVLSLLLLGLGARALRRS